MIRAMSGHGHINLVVQDADDEVAARSLLTDKGVPLDHVHFFQIEHLDIWARDMGPQFRPSRSGQLRINDWHFNYLGYEEPESFNSAFEEMFDRTVASIRTAAGAPKRQARCTSVPAATCRRPVALGPLCLPLEPVCDDRQRPKHPGANASLQP